MAIQGQAGTVVDEPGQLASGGEQPTAAETPGLWLQLYRLVFSRLALSIGGQAMVSGFHFALNLLLLRLVSPYEYGVFAFAFVLAMFASAVNNALIATPLTVYTPVVKDPARRAEQEGMYSTLNLLLFVVLLGGGLMYAGLVTDHPGPSMGAAVFIAVYAARHYSRSMGYARLQPLVTASGDASYVIAGCLIIGALVWLLPELSIGIVLLALAAANGCAMLVERLRLHGRQRRWFSLSQIGGYRTVWLQSRWALVGALTTLFLAQAHSLIITSTHGPSAYAPLAAGFVLFGPMRVALMTWQNMVKPEIAMALADSKAASVRQQIRKSSLVTAAAVVLLGLALWLAWPWLHGFLYEKNYSEQPMARIVALWAVITFCAASYNAPSAALQAMHDFRILAMASLYGAAISGVLVTALLFLVNPETTLFGILAAEAFMALFLTRVLYRRLAARSLSAEPESARDGRPV